MKTSREPNYQEQSIIDFYRINPASFKLYMTWDWHTQVLKKHGVICSDCPDPEVSRISKNRTRVDNASVACSTVTTFDPDVMLRHVLGIGEPWRLVYFRTGMYERTDFRKGFLRGEVQICIDVPSGRYPCPNCGALCRILGGTTGTAPILRCAGWPRSSARVPKLACDACDGYPQMAVPWARPKVTYTKLLEERVFLLLCDMPVSSAAEHTGLRMGVVWDMVSYRMGEALGRMDLSDVTMLYVDETSSRKGHSYITVVSDQNRRVIYIREGRDSTTMDDLREWLLEHRGDPLRIATVSCDLGDAFPAGVRRNFDNARIVYDRFHVVKLANEAMDEVVRRYMADYSGLLGMRRWLMKNQSSLTEEQSDRIWRVIDDYRPVAECYRLKNVLASIYDYGDADSASRALELWAEEARRTGHPSMLRLSETVWSRREGILAWYDDGVSNGYAEGLNSLIQTTKRMARGYRNIDHFISMIYLRDGNLDIRFDREAGILPRGGRGAPREIGIAARGERGEPAGREPAQRNDAAPSVSTGSVVRLRVSDDSPDCTSPHFNPKP